MVSTQVIVNVGPKRLPQTVADLVYGQVGSGQSCVCVCVCVCVTLVASTIVVGTRISGVSCLGSRQFCVTLVASIVHCGRQN